MEGLIFSEDLCRLCLWRSNKLLPIFSEEGELQGIPGKIGLCLPISVSKDDFLPKLICSRCIYKLETFSEFRNSCLRSEELLKRYTVPAQVQAEPCQTAAVVQCGEDDVKLEVSETESIAIVHEAPPLSSLIVEPETVGTEILAVEETQLQTPVIESVNSISTDVLTQDVPGSPVKKRKVATKSLASEAQGNEGTTVKARRNINNCKYCSKNFASRVQLSEHLTSSNCLFRYTCRYCAKIFVTAENKLQHEKNHKNKKNLICGICKQVFQSSFELNVHAVHGCEPNDQQPNKPKTNKKKKVISSQVQKSLSEIAKSSSESQAYSCYVCSKVYRQNTHFQKHVRACKRSVRMANIQAIRRRNHQMQLGQKIISANEKTDKVHPPGIRTRKPSRRKQTLTPIQDVPPMDSPPSITSKASLLAVLGLKEKPKPKEEPQVETVTETNVGSPDVIVVEEVVTVCDICRKIFTSETGMLNHQITVHNRNLTAEKIHTLMRVEI